MIKKILICSLCVMLALTSCQSAIASEQKIEALTMDMCEKPGTVVILATGGTIAGTGEKGKVTGYKPGQITAEELIDSIPELAEVAPIEALQVCNINSDDITSEIWLTLAKTINEKAKDPNVAGFVITHGTDTMDETAYFLNLTLKTDKPVVLTGAMRPATSISADGPMNLYQSVTVAANEKSKGRGVLIVFSDTIYSARFMTKSNTSAVAAMAGGSGGEIGNVIDNNVYFNYHVDNKHTLDSEFDITDINKLKDVPVVYFNAEFKPEIFKKTLENSSGVVVAGAGMGEYSLEFIDLIKNAKIPIVVSSRVGSGIIDPNSLLNDTAVSAINLPPQKAAVLLRVCLTFNKSIDEMRRIFLEY